MPNYPYNHDETGLDDFDQPIDVDEEATYTIVRFTWGKPNEIIKEGVTLEEAQEHCNSEDTHGDGWFDGYCKDE